MKISWVEHPDGPDAFSLPSVAARALLILVVMFTRRYTGEPELVNYGF